MEHFDGEINLRRIWIDGLYNMQPVIPMWTRLFLRPEATAVWRDGPAVDRGDSKQRTGPEFDSHWGPGKIYCYTDFVCEGERVGARVFFQLMTPTKQQQRLFGKQFIFTLIYPLLSTNIWESKYVIIGSYFINNKLSLITIPTKLQT